MIDLVGLSNEVKERRNACDLQSNDVFQRHMTDMEKKIIQR